MIDHSEKITTKLERSDTHTSYSYKICKELESRIDCAEKLLSCDMEIEYSYELGRRDALLDFYKYLKNLLLGESK